MKLNILLLVLSEYHWDWFVLIFQHVHIRKIIMTQMIRYKYVILKIN